VIQKEEYSTLLRQMNETVSCLAVKHAQNAKTICMLVGGTIEFLNGMPYEQTIHHRQDMDNIYHYLIFV
jgi:hypothetical protein